MGGGEALKVLRIYHDYKIGELSKKIGVSQGYLSEIENNKKSLSLNLIKKYAEVFQTKPSVILSLTEKIENPSFAERIKAALSRAVINVLEEAAYATEEVSEKEV